MFARMVPFGPSAIDPAFILFAALVLDAVLGDPKWLYRLVPHPVAVFGALIGALERRLNRESRSERTRRLRGVLVAGLVVALALLAAGSLLFFIRQAPWGWAAEAVVAGVLVAQRDLYVHVAAVAVALESGGLVAGRKAVGEIVGRDPDGLDEHGVARGAIESLAENFADGVVAPVFWYLVAGLPGMLAAKAINTLDSMIAHTSPRYRAFGEAAARLDTAINYLPARIASMILALAALVAPSANPAAAFATIWRDARRHRSLNAGWPEAAAAGALGLALAGPRRYGGHVVDDPWIGGGRARATAHDIRRALYLYVIACLIVAGLVAGVALTREATRL